PEQVVAYPPEHFPSARALASLIAEHFTLHNTAGIGFTNLLLISPPMQRRFLADGWSKEDLRRYLFENVRVSLAKAKRTVGTAGAGEGGTRSAPPARHAAPRRSEGFGTK